MKMARFQTFWIQMRKNKPLDESRKSRQTSGAKVAFYSFHKIKCTLTRTLIAKRPNTAPEAPSETAFLGSTSHETRFAPTPVRI
ncbi:hypothetical protein Hanom_Chr02g00141611 [Helianthus anomalus]